MIVCVWTMKYNNNKKLYAQAAGDERTQCTRSTPLDNIIPFIYSSLTNPLHRSSPHHIFPSLDSFAIAPVRQRFCVMLFASDMPQWNRHIHIGMQPVYGAVLMHKKASSQSTHSIKASVVVCTSACWCSLTFIQSVVCLCVCVSVWSVFLCSFILGNGNYVTIEQQKNKQIEFYIFLCWILTYYLVFLHVVTFRIWLLRVVVVVAALEISNTVSALCAATSREVERLVRYHDHCFALVVVYIVHCVCTHNCSHWTAWCNANGNGNVQYFIPAFSYIYVYIYIYWLVLGVVLCSPCVCVCVCYGGERVYFVHIHRGRTRNIFLSTSRLMGCQSSSLSDWRMQSIDLIYIFIQCLCCLPYLPFYFALLTTYNLQLTTHKT